MADLAAILQNTSLLISLIILCVLAAGYTYAFVIRPLLLWKNNAKINFQWVPSFIKEPYNDNEQLKKQHEELVKQSEELQQKLKEEQQKIHQLNIQQNQNQQNLEVIESKLKKTIDDYEDKLKNELENIVDIIHIPSHLLEEFLQDIPNKLKFFTEKLRLFQENTAGYGMIYDLHTEIRNVKNSLRLLKFKPLVAQVQKIEVLLDIVSHRNEGFKIEQISEIENMMRDFMGSLQRYIQIVEKFIATQSKNAPKKQGNTFTNTQRSVIDSYLDNIQRAAFSLTVPPGTTAEYLQKIEKSLGILPTDAQIFEFSEQFRRILHFLKIKFLSRQVKLSTSHESKKILLYGDSVKISKLLTLVTSMSFLRGEIGSSLKIETRIIPNKRKNSSDTLQINTSVGIRNTDKKTLARIQKLSQEYQLLCNECAAELSSTKRGFEFTIPMVINKKLPEVLEIGILGHTPANLIGKIREIEETIPMQISVTYLESPDFSEIDTLVITSQSLNQFSEQISDMKQSLYAIPVILIAANDFQEKENFPENINYLRLPIRKHELKWSFFRCLQEIIPLSNEILQTTSVFYKVPKK